MGNTLGLIGLLISVASSGALGSTSGLLVAANPSPSPAPSANPVFAPILTTLGQQTTVPILLPTQLPPTAVTLYSDILTASSNLYTVELATVAGCNTVQACTYGFVAGYSAGAGPVLTGSPVTLSNGTKGYFTAPYCGGAGCSASLLMLQAGGNIYEVGLKGGTLGNTLLLANSMTHV